MKDYAGTVVTTTLYLWAIPNNYAKSEDDLFNFEVSESRTHWNNKAIRITETEAAMVYPHGVDLLDRAVETIAAKQEELRATAYKDIEELEAYKKSLLQLTHQPADPEAIEGEYDAV